MLLPAQCRAARALLGIDQEELARLSGVGANTIIAFEKERRAPRTSTLNALRHALEKAGVSLIDGDWPGVRRRKAISAGDTTLVEGEGE